MTSLTPRRRRTHVALRSKTRTVVTLSTLNVTLAAALAVALSRLGGAL
jgi:hypothetical protein